MKKVRICRTGLTCTRDVNGSSARFAQSTTEGAIGGTVVDQSKAVVPGATVTAKNLATNSTATATTDASGHFTVIRLHAGYLHR